MRKLYVACFLFSLATSSFSAQLLPGAHVYHLSKVSANDFPVISGKIINETPDKPVTATNELTVPNTLPAVVADMADYTVTPPVSKSGYEEWTKSVKYTDSDGNGCYIQFAWDMEAKMPDVAVTSVNDDSHCEVPDGTNIGINSSY